MCGFNICSSSDTHGCLTDVQIRRWKCRNLGGQETTIFNSECYVKFLMESFSIFDCELDAWCLALISDNISTNKKFATITKKPLIGCANHKLSLEVRHMIDRHAYLRETVNSVHQTMKDIKFKSKSAAVLRNLTELRPIMDNATMWSGKVAMLARFNEIRNEIIDAADDPDSDFCG